MDDASNTPPPSDNTAATPTSDAKASDDSFKIPVPKDIAEPVQKFTSKLTNAAEGADDVADNLEKAMDHGVDVIEKKLDNFISGLDKFLGKF